MEIEWKDEILYKDLVKWECRLKREAPFFKDLVKNFDVKNSQVLDVSCGTGFHSVMLAKWGYCSVGVDISEQNIKEADNLAKNEEVESKVEFILGDILDIQNLLADRKFDFIYCIGNTLAIFDLHERKKIIQQLTNLLKPGGKLLIQVVNYLAHSNETEWFYKPNLMRTSDGLLNFQIRMMDWKEHSEKINMYIHRIIQDTSNSDMFELIQKKTEFYVLKKKDFQFMSEQKTFELKFLGDYNFNQFDEEKSNDLVVIIKKKN